MPEYEVYISDRAHESVRTIVRHKVNHGSEKAKSFADGFYELVRSLHTLPYSGFPVADNLHGQLYDGHKIVYEVANDTVSVLDIIDLKQHSKAQKYL